MQHSVLLHPSDGPRDLDANDIDVEVHLEDGTRYGATFFTLRGLERAMREGEETGECLAGLYFWWSDLIVVKDLSRATIEACVADLLSSQEFELAFSLLEHIDLSEEE